jgi:pyocin large subunit-like protein
VPFRNVHELRRHFIRHGEDFDAQSAEEYGSMAEAFMTGPIRIGVKHCVRKSDEAIIRFDPQNFEFGVMSKTGVIWTYMIVRSLKSSSQTPEQYFASQCK